MDRERDTELDSTKGLYSSRSQTVKAGGAPTLATCIAQRSYVCKFATCPKSTNATEMEQTQTDRDRDTETEAETETEGRDRDTDTHSFSQHLRVLPSL